ncbi:uncharacterized protein [Nicotiana sylvestris]|uniref:uncharacterized protein n=1 Tax=Nicotiana sylvestris TaxID=4096 RepID=UPI00388C656C
MASRGVSRRRAPVPAFCQVVAFAGMQFTLYESSLEGHAQLVQVREPSRDMLVRGEIPSLPVHHLLDESSNGDESSLKKKRRIELGKSVVVDTGKSRMGASNTALVPMFMADAILAGRSLQTEGVYQGGGLCAPPRVAHHLLSAGVYVPKVASTFAPLCAAPESEALKEISDVELSRSDSGMALQVEELKERDEDLMKAVAHSRELEAALRAKEDELELSRGVVAKNADLQAKVASLTVELDMKTVEVDELKGELSVNADRLARAERERAIAVSEAAVSEDSLCVCRLERAKEIETSALKAAELERRIQGLEAELFALNKQVDSLKAENVRQQS